MICQSSWVVSTAQSLFASLLLLLSRDSNDWRWAIAAGNLSQFGARARLNSVWFDSRDEDESAFAAKRQASVANRRRSSALRLRFRESFWECFFTARREHAFYRAHKQRREWYRISKEQVRGENKNIALSKRWRRKYVDGGEVQRCRKRHQESAEKW